MRGYVALEEGLLRYGELLPDHLLGVAPAAGASFALPLDSRWWWRIKAVRFTLTTSAAVANRFVTVDVQDPEGTAWVRSPSPVVQAAGVTAQEYDFAERNEIVSGLAGQPIFADLVPLWIPGGWRLAITVGLIDGGDQLGAPRLYVEKFQPCAE